MGSFMSNSMSRLMTIMTVLVLITSLEIKKGKIVTYARYLGC